MPAFEARPGMPYWQDLATTDPQKAGYFYAKLFGWELGQGSYRIARKEGLPVAGLLAEKNPVSTWVTYFRGTPERVEKLGGRVFGSDDAPMGRMTLCQDPAGALFGLMEPAGEDSFVAAGEPGVPVWFEYVAPHQEAVDFYAELLDWEVGRDGDYFTALVDGAPFLGLAIADDAPGGMWRTYFGVADIESAARSVRELGGLLIDGPVSSPFGPLAVAEDPAGAGFFLCEVPEPAPEDVDEAESLLL